MAPRLLAGLRCAPDVRAAHANIIQPWYPESAGAFFKVMSAWEFALMLPLLTVGAPLNALEFGLSWPKRIAYGLALVPATLAALAVALAQLPAYTAKRRQLRSAASGRQSWCLRALFRTQRGAPPATRT